MWVYYGSMNKNIIVVAGLAVLILIVGFFSSGSDDIVLSSDGRLSISIPANALPDGVSLEDVTITKELVPDFYGPDTPDPVEVYNLEPDGLVLSKAATITYTSTWQPPSGPGEAIHIPVAVHKSGDTFAVLNDNIVEFNEELGTVTLESKIDHFSSYRFDQQGAFYYHVTVRPKWWISEYNIGETMELAFIVGHFTEKEPRTNRKYGHMEHVPVGESWKFISNDTGFSGGGGYFTPSDRLSIPSVTKKVGDSYEVAEVKTCVKEGQDTFNLVGNFELEYDLQSKIPYIWGRPEPGELTYINGLPNPIHEKHHKTSVEKNYRTKVRAVIASPFYKCKEAPAMVQIDPPKVFLQAGSEEIGARDSEYGWANEDGVKMYNGKPVDTNPQSQELEAVR